MISLILKPAALTAKGQRFEAWWGEGLVCTSRQSLYEAARTLALDGVPFDTVIEASHEGQETVAMRSTIGVAAQWSVGEGELAGLSRRYWTPFGEPRTDGPACMVLPQTGNTPESAVSAPHVSTASAREDELAGIMPPEV